MSELNLPSPGDTVWTPRGTGWVVQVQVGAEGAIVTVDLEAGMVDFEPGEVLLASVVTDLDTIAGVQQFLAGPAAEEQLEKVEAFLAMETTSKPAPLSGGRTHGARTLLCDCDCGREGGCLRLSTAPSVHRENVSTCACEREGCECLDG